jgi:glucose-1-phosphate adenylyltransferase
VRIHAGAMVDDSIVFDNCDIGRKCKVRRAVLDKNVILPEGTTIGYDLEADRERYHVTESGIVCVPGSRSRVSVSSLSF